ncbi:MAG: hypothetical protein WEC75_00595 [Dehalococcoidia bacterium]
MTRVRSWFDKEKLLPDERLVRESPARLHSDAPPRWWEGELILTTDRLFFLPEVYNPLIGDAGFWLRDVVECDEAGRNRLRIAGDNAFATFELTAGVPSLSVITGRGAGEWRRAIARLIPQARPRQAFDEFLQHALEDAPAPADIEEALRRRRQAG